MLIECPFCHTRAKLAESKEGAKVRCADCSKVYRAREILSGGRKQSTTNSSGPIIAVIVIAVIGFGALFVMKQSDSPAPVKAAPAKVEVAALAPEVAVDPMGWDSELVQLVVGLHAKARDRDEDALRSLIEASRLDFSETEKDWSTWSDLDEAGQAERIILALDSLIDRTETGTVADWVPYDGSVFKIEGDIAIVQVSASPGDGGTTKRVVEWTLVRDGESWKAYSWIEWLTEAEKRRRARGFEVVKLSDGSVVAEREPEPLEHLEDTPPELRERIDQLMVTLLDLNLTTKSAKASAEISEIGKPAIPALLTHLFENKLSSDDDSVRANIAVVALRDITDQFFGYQPMAFVGSAMGTTEERRISAVRQWFAWWYRKGEAFTGIPEDEDEDE
ncbi:MAG: putative Zn finger-like uncharacterized protein [Planctomycetota bacterium]|jgi:predicted Zn finger-like uncharacterized protein